MAAPPRNRVPESGDVGQFVETLGIDLSTTVKSVVERFGGKPVTSWELVEAILARHPEYARSVRPPRGESFDRTVAGNRPAHKWIQDVAELLRAERIKRLNGRLLIASLARLDSSLEHTLAANGFLNVLTRELRPDTVAEPYPEEAERRVEPPLPPPGTLPDQVPLQYDSPTLQDQLGRQGFARALAIRFERIWRRGEKEQPGSFIFHLHGAWGSGKTSLLDMLRVELQAPLCAPTALDSGEGTRPRGGPVAAEPWVVVNFNAWQHQRLDPPWWFLLDAVYRQGRDQLRGCLNQPDRAARLRARETVWRVSMARLDVIIAGVILLALAIASALVLFDVFPGEASPATAQDSTTAGQPTAAADSNTRRDTTAAQSYPKMAQDITAILSLIASVVTVVALLARSLLSGSARAAQRLVQGAGDPMDRISKHFHRLLCWIKAPVLVVIDDLDRCQPSYVVSLLEGIQTLFTDWRVMYVLSGDRRWLYACFERAYEPFASSVQEPGRRLGSLFLEKAVQLSASVPRLSADIQEAYWRYLLGKDPQEARAEAARMEAEIRQDFEPTAGERQVFAQMKALEGPDPIRQQVVRQVAIEHLASAPLEQSTFYFLQPFAPLLEPNPRAMKRLLNDYSMQRDHVIWAGYDLSDEKRRKQLALWTILCLRWPVLEEPLIALVADQPRPLPPGLNDLVHSPAVKLVLEGKCVGTPLDREAIRWLGGLRATEGAPGGSMSTPASPVTV